VAGAVLFATDAVRAELVPRQSRQFDQRLRRSNVQRSLLRNAVSSRSASWQRGTAVPGQSGPTTDVAVVPLVWNTETAFLLHVEFIVGDTVIGGVAADIGPLVALCEAIAPVFASLALRNSIDSLVLGMAETINAAIETKDTYTGGHSERVAKYSLAIADKLGLDHATKKTLYVSAICHDLGKIGIPDSILKKPSMLSNEEFEEMKQHPTLGQKIVERMPGAVQVLTGIVHHHERWDGTGYPDGLAGERIPLMARIIAVADAFDAMTSGRSYSGYVDPGEAVGQLVEKVDLFDPDILKAFGEAHDAGGLTMRTGTVVR
jgi:HD-GYP domain-containing protein (c-di-GMP phosphodiesterase class II)